MNDQVVDDTKVQEFARYLKVALVALVVAGVVAAGYLFWQQQVEKKSQRGFEALFQVEKLEEAAEKEAEAVSAAPLQVMLNWPEAKKNEYEEKLSAVVEDHKSTAAAYSAQLRLARWKLHLSRPAEAAELYRKVISDADGKDKRVFKAMAYEGLGVALETEQKFPEAEKVYNDALGMKDNPLKPLAYLGSARVLKSLGKKEEERSAYQKLIQEFPNTPYERKARVLMALGG